MYSCVLQNTGVSVLMIYVIMKRKFYNIYLYVAHIASMGRTKEKLYIYLLDNQVIDTSVNKFFVYTMVYTNELPPGLKIS